MYGRQDLNEPAQIWELQDGSDLGGGATEKVWTHVGDTFIRLEPNVTGQQAGGLTQRLGGQVDGTVTHQVMSRYPFTRGDGSQVPLSDNVRLDIAHRGLKLHVLSAINFYDRSEKVKLLCREVQG